MDVTRLNGAVVAGLGKGIRITTDAAVNFSLSANKLTLDLVPPRGPVSGRIQLTQDNHGTVSGGGTIVDFLFSDDFTRQLMSGDWKVYVSIGPIASRTEIGQLVFNVDVPLGGAIAE